MKRPSPREVIEANRQVYESKRFDDCEKNPSISDPVRQAETDRVIRTHAVAGGRMLDLGCGTGNTLRVGKKYFRRRVGVDLSQSLLAELLRRSSDLALVQAEAGDLPFFDGAFDFCSLYALLHHHPAPTEVLREAGRCLKPGGWLYTDHDPNYYFGRFYHLYYRIRYARRPGFGTDLEEIAEFHNTQTGGIDPESLAEFLRSSGFDPVHVRYWLTTSPGLTRLQRLVRGLLRFGLRLHPLRSLHTHFSLQARKT